jgi:hypothetical protein
VTHAPFPFARGWQAMVKYACVTVLPGYRADGIKCNVDPYDWNGKKDFRTIRYDNNSLNRLPDFVFISLDENDFDLAQRVYEAVQWWDLTQF